MLENKTYESILEESLERVTSNIDKREGSLIYDAIAPCSFQLAQFYFEMINMIDLIMPDTAVAEYLDREFAQFGVLRKRATNAIRKVNTNSVIEVGTRWELNGLVYKITAKHTDTLYSAICETKGVIGNIDTGVLTSLDNVSSVIATLGAIETTGTDEESDDDFRKRALTMLRRPSTSGNVNHYKQWALEVNGIGDAKVFPLWNGPGTVKVVIVNSEKHPASEELVDSTKDHIEKVRPIGAEVTVVSGVAKQINTSAEVVLAPGYRLQDVIDQFKEVITEYFKSIAFSLSYVSYAKIGTMLLNVEGVLDYSLLKINNVVTNISLNEEEIPVLGIVELVV